MSWTSGRGGWSVLHNAGEWLVFLLRESVAFAEARPERPPQSFPCLAQLAGSHDDDGVEVLSIAFVQLPDALRLLDAGQLAPLVRADRLECVDGKDHRWDGPRFSTPRLSSRLCSKCMIDSMTFSLWNPGAKIAETEEA